ncbi:HAD-like protein [Patellaria atrata CBS 101060]|uniref:HAD-like protein n=1 Tax=Patellaria atrata CBS 101060 TaxID=1346257 RepID=A0A9P4SFT4_9PEZI|nr:HAD-like protein [Patellaria atrata CBS 101060]
MTHVPSSRTLKSFTLMSFDVYGTLVDWERGIKEALLSSPHFSLLPSSHALQSQDGTALLHAFERHERRIQSAQPALDYTSVLAEAYTALVSEHGLKEAEGRKEDVEEAAKAFAATQPHWPAFPDTVDAMKRLSKTHTLVALSNTARGMLAQALSSDHPLHGVPFAAIYTADQIGSYKPDARNFEYLEKHAKEEFGVEKGKILHVAQSLFHDHMPAPENGFELGVWVDRSGVMGEQGGYRSRAKYGWRVETLKQLADLVDAET